MSQKKQNSLFIALNSLLLLVTLFLGGCAQTTSKDAEEENPWPELAEQADNCNALTGFYSANPRQHGKAHTESSPLLAYTLLPASPKLSGADRVQLEVTPTELTVTALAGSTPLTKETYHPEMGIFNCIADTIEFRTKAKPAAEETTSTHGIDWETIRLRRTQDGSLLLQKADGLASLAFMLFPIYLTSDNWYLFKRVEEVPKEP